MWALIENKIVIELTDIDPKGRFHPDFVWIECPAQTQTGWTFNGKAFAAPPGPSIDDMKTERISQLAAACSASIMAGYRSEALGAMHAYPNALTDQINMLGSVASSLLPALPSGWTTPFWCADEAGAWAFRPHSAEQIQQAGDDGKAHVILCQSTLETLTAAVNAAATGDAVAAIAWPNI